VKGGEADFAMWNPGGIRADLPAKSGTSSTPVTYADGFSVLPFGNILITKTVTGDQILRMLQKRVGFSDRLLQFSEGFAFSFDKSRPPGQQVDPASVRIKGMPLDPKKRYRMAASNFIWDGGEGNDMLASASDAVTIGVDVDLFADYMASHSPLRPAPQDRIRRIR